MIFDNAQLEHVNEEDGSEKQVLKYASIVGACIILALKIASRWVPSMDIYTRGIALSFISFGPAIVISRKELNHIAVWGTLCVAASIHCVILWFFQDYLKHLNMWLGGIYSIVEGLLLLAVIEALRPRSKRLKV
jgi:hypothetical protein